MGLMDLYTQKETRLLCMLPAPKASRVAEKGVKKKKTGVTPLVGLMDPYTREECGVLNVTGSKGPTCGV